MKKESDPRLSRLIVALAFASFFSFLFLRYTYLSFEKIRNSLINEATAAANGSIRLHFQAPENEDAKILLLVIKNNQTSNSVIDVRLNSSLERAFEVSAQDSKSISFPVQGLVKDNELLLQGNGSGWILKTVEIRNLYGSLKSPLLKYVIVDRHLADYVHPSLVAGSILFLILMLVGCYGAECVLGFKSWLRAWPLYFVLLFFLAILIAPVISVYRLLLSVKTFFIFLIIAYLPAAGKIYTKIAQAAEARFRNGRPIFNSTLILLAVFSFFYLSMIHSLEEYQGNYSGFVHLSKKFISRNLMLRGNEQVLKKLKITDGGGYDSQFFYFITFDPFLQRFADQPLKYKKSADNTPYRYRRILFPILTKSFSLDDPDLYPKTMVWLILFFCVIGAFFVLMLANFYRKRALWACLSILIPGFTFSLAYGLPEPIAASLFLAGLYFYCRERTFVPAVLFALALLVRETLSLAILAVVFYEFFKKKNGGRAIFLLCSFAPYFLWRLFVTWRLFDVYGWYGFFFEPPNFTFPFFGIAELIQNIKSGDWPGVINAAGISFPILLTLMFVLSVLALRKRIDFLTVPFSLYSLLALSQNYQSVWLSVGNAERLSFESFMFSILVFLSLDEQKTLRRLFVCFFGLVLIYNWCFFTQHLVFRAGFLWE